MYQLKSYHIIFTKAARKDLDSINEKDSKKISNKIDLLIEDTKNLDIKKISGSKEPTYRLRYGDYRVIFEIHNQEITILIIRIGHRKAVYKRRGY